MLVRALVLVLVRALALVLVRALVFMSCRAVEGEMVFYEFKCMVQCNFRLTARVLAIVIVTVTFITTVRTIVIANFTINAPASGCVLAIVTVTFAVTVLVTINVPAPASGCVR